MTSQATPTRDRADSARAAMVFALLACGLMILGCETSQSTNKAKPSVVLRPADFVRTPNDAPAGTPATRGIVETYVAGVTARQTPPTAAEPATNGAAASADTATDPNEAIAATPPTVTTGDEQIVAAGPVARRAGTPGNPIIVDAMVGQIHGEHIYASEVFQRIGEPTLVRLGGELTRPAFRARVSQMVQARLNEIIVNRLILRQARNDLTEQMQFSLPAMRELERERVIRRYGGTQWQAEQGLLRDYGLTMDEWLEQQERQGLVDRYMQMNIRNKVHVNRREVERYYRDHFDEFNRPATATGRVIIVRRDGGAADAVDAALAAGEPFAEIAERHSIVYASQGGLLPQFVLSDAPIRFEPIKEAFKGLEQGAHSQRLEIELPNGTPAYGWAYIERLEGGQNLALKDVFLQIEQQLRVQKLSVLQRQHINELMRESAYTDIERMTSAVMEVALARYAAPL